MVRGARIISIGILLFAIGASPAFANRNAADQPRQTQTGLLEAHAVAEDPASVPPQMVEIYRFTAETATCTVPWTLLAGVADFAADHARGAGDGVLNAAGTVEPTLLGPVLDGADGRELITDTDGGLIDLDADFDRAVGPFQFIPQTWAAWAADGNGDGQLDPNNAWDGARAAANLLCANQVDIRPERALTAYFGTDLFNTDVMRKAASIAAEISLDVGFGRIDHLWSAAPAVAAGDLEFRRLDSTPDDDATSEGLAAPIVSPAPFNTRVHQSALVFGTFEAGAGPQPAAFVPWEAGGSSFLLASGGADDGSLESKRLEAAGTTPIVGDWNGDGADDVGVVDDSLPVAVSIATLVEGEVLTWSIDREHLPASGEWVSGDWNGDGSDSVGFIASDDERGVLELHAFDRFGEPFGQRFETAAAIGEHLLVGDWDGDGVDTPAVLGSNELTVFDRLGAQLEVRTVSTPGERASLVVGTAPRAARTQQPVDLDSSRDAAYFGPAVAHDGTELELWRVRGILVDESIATDLLGLLQAAEADGIDLSGWGWRSHQAQIRLREAHCVDVWASPASSCSPPTAIPGTSRHEFGIAVDFTSEGRTLTWGSEAFAWMADNADDYGFINLPSEAWHWSVDGG